MSEHLNEKFLKALKEMNTIMKSETTNGKQWRYSNSDSKQAHTFDKARSSNKRYLNCVLGVRWGLRIAGVPDKALHWQGVPNKVSFSSDTYKKEALKYFELISTGGKTVSQLYKAGKLCDGDILLGFGGNMYHTCVYYGDGKSFDTGHAYCTGSGENALYKKWLGSLTCKSSKVYYIMRLKDRAHYRVQAGAFTNKDKLDEQVKLIQSKGYKTQVFEEDGYFKIQVGYFAGKTNANNLVTELQKKGISSFVKEV